MDQENAGQAPAKSEFDVFQWANSVDEVKNNISVELFLFNKNYTPYKVRYTDISALASWDVSNVENMSFRTERTKLSIASISKRSVEPKLSFIL